MNYGQPADWPGGVEMTLEELIAIRRFKQENLYFDYYYKDSNGKPKSIQVGNLIAFKGHLDEVIIDYVRDQYDARHLPVTMIYCHGNYLWW